MSRVVSLRDAVNDTKVTGNAKIAAERIKGRASVGLSGNLAQWKEFGCWDFQRKSMAQQ